MALPKRQCPSGTIRKIPEFHGFVNSL